MIVAEELHCDWAKVKCEYASATRNLREKSVYHSMTTVGSSGVRTSVDFLQQAGASARGRLIEAAAQRWQCDVSECSCDKGRITRISTKRTLSYGDVCAAAVAVKLDTEPKVTAPDEFRRVGQSTPRLDTPAKIYGSAKFGIDARVPGMVYAAVIGWPGPPGGKVRSVDDSALQGRPGIIQVVRMDGAVAVAADKFWRAKTAADLLKIEWDTGESGKVQQADLDQLYRDVTLQKMVSARADGDAAKALADPGANRIIEALYEAPYQAHAPDGAAQRHGLDSAGPAGRLGLHPVAAGGASGRRRNRGHVRGQGVRARQLHRRRLRPSLEPRRDAPSRVCRQGYRQAGQAGVDARAGHAARPLPPAGRRPLQGVAAPRRQGRRAGGAHRRVPSLQRLAGARPGAERHGRPGRGDASAPLAYKIPNLSVGANLHNTHVPVSYCRGVGSSQNGFFIESFIDELAHAAGQDPYQFRRAHL